MQVAIQKCNAEIDGQINEIFVCHCPDSSLMAHQSKQGLTEMWAFVVSGVWFYVTSMSARFINPAAPTKAKNRPKAANCSFVWNQSQGGILLIEFILTAYSIVPNVYGIMTTPQIFVWETGTISKHNLLKPVPIRFGYLLIYDKYRKYIAIFTCLV
jgi:hypothetical protein